MAEFPLQHFVERHRCKYFAENDTASGTILNLALRSPFVRLYALNRNAGVVAEQKFRYSENERIQLFFWTHSDSWQELVRLVPFEQPSVFWMHASENVGKGLTTLGRLRPLRTDVLLFEVGKLRGVLTQAERHFSRTHRILVSHGGDRVEALSWGTIPMINGSVSETATFVLSPRANGK